MLRPLLSPALRRSRFLWSFPTADRQLDAQAGACRHTHKVIQLEFVELTAQQLAGTWLRHAEPLRSFGLRPSLALGVVVEGRHQL